MRLITRQDQREEITVIVGAGFSSAMAGMKLSKDFSSNLHSIIEDKLIAIDTPLDLRKWILEFKNPSSSVWDFELMMDLLKHCNALNHHKFPSMYYKEQIDPIIEFINQELYKEYSQPKIDNGHANKFKQLIHLFINQGYTVNIFDLNFDLIIESIFSSDMNYNDYFGEYNLKGLYRNRPIDFTDSFDSDLHNKINHFKLHGAFNIVHYFENMPPDSRDLHKFGFRKFKLDSDIIQGLSNNYLKALDDINFYNFGETGSFLITGNLNKLAHKGLGLSYLDFAFKNLHRSFDNSNLTMVIGYGGNDPDINPLLVNNLAESFVQPKPTKTLICKNRGVTSSELSYLFTDGDDNFEDFLDKHFS